MADIRQSNFANFRVPDPPRIRKVRKWLNESGYLDSDGKDIRVLEIGYSRGGLLDNLCEFPAIRKYAVDINDRECPDGISFCRHDCNHGLPDFDDTRFDIVFAGEVIEHIFDDESFLKQVYDRLNPGGILALTVPHLFYLVNRILFPFGKMPYFAYAPFHYHFYSIRSLTGILAKAGFKVLKVKSSHVLVSSRRGKGIGRILEHLGDVCPSLGAHLIVFAEKKPGQSMTHRALNSGEIK